jgi:hypothetical protein
VTIKIGRGAYGRQFDVFSHQSKRLLSIANLVLFKKENLKKLFFQKIVFIDTKYNFSYLEYDHFEYWMIGKSFGFGKSKINIRIFTQVNSCLTLTLKKNLKHFYWKVSIDV